MLNNELEIQSRIKDFLHKEGILYLDVLDEFRINAESKQLYIPNDGHCNYEGNKLIANHVEEWIEKYLIVTF
jgi:lysophospholipase L1-like esterase